MVKSLLKNEIIYNEKTELEEQDKNYESSLYEIELLDINITIAIGKIKNTSDLNISYFPLAINDCECDFMSAMFFLVSSAVATKKSADLSMSFLISVVVNLIPSTGTAHKNTATPHTIQAYEKGMDDGTLRNTMNEQTIEPKLPPAATMPMHSPSESGNSCAQRPGTIANTMPSAACT